MNNRINQQGGRSPLLNKRVFKILFFFAFICSQFYLVLIFHNWSADNEILFRSPVVIQDRNWEEVEQVQEVEVIEIEKEKSIEEVIIEVFGGDSEIALAVMFAESRGDYLALNLSNSNGSIDVGLFQINSIHYDSEGCSFAEVVTIEGNIYCAYSIFKESGWSAWSSYNSGAYLKHIK